MADPVSMSAAAIATLIATKAFEETGKKVGEAVWKQVSGFLAALRKKDPATAGAIEAVAQQPELAVQQPENYGTAMLVAKAEEAAADPEVQQAAQAVANAVSVEPATIQNLTKLAEKIGVLNQGTMINPVFNQNF